MYKRKTESEQVQLEAVKQNGYAIKYIKKPSNQVLSYMEKNHLDILLEYFDKIEEAN